MKDVTDTTREDGAEVAVPATGQSIAPSAAYFAMAALLVAKVLLARLLVLGAGSVLGGLLLESVFVFAALGLAEIFFQRWRRNAYLAVDAFVSLFLLTLTIYAAYYDQIVSPAALKLAGLVPSVSSSVLALLRPVHALFFLDFVVLFAFSARLTRFMPAEDGLASRRVLAISGASLAVCGLLSISAAGALAGNDSIDVARVRGLLAYESAAAVQFVVGDGASPIVSPLGAAHADEAGAGPTIDFSRPTSVQRAIDAAVQPEPGERIAEFEPGQYAGANVIVVQVESLQHFVIDDWVTPRLDELRRESWYFPNTFSQSGLGTTSDAEFVMNTSLYPPSQEPASVAYEGRIVPALPRLLDAQGYDAFTMHANTVNYWNRKELYPALGFERYYDVEFFGRERVIGMGASDRTLFKKALPVIAEQAAKGPIYCQLITLSPHHPFKMPPNTIKIDLPSWLDGSTVGNYLEAMNYEDRQIGWFVDELKANGLWDNTIFVVYGDHAGLRTGDLKDGLNMARLESILGHGYTVVDRANVPLLIHLPEQDQGVWCESDVGQIDIMPTIADALGLDLAEVPHAGRSAFVAGDSFLARCSGLPKRAFVAAGTVVVPGADGLSFYDVKTRQKLSAENPVAEEGARAQRILDITDAWVLSLPERSGSGGIQGAIIPRKLPASGH